MILQESSKKEGQLESWKRLSHGVTTEKSEDSFKKKVVLM
jgi:hypothetical protein